MSQERCQDRRRRFSVNRVDTEEQRHDAEDPSTPPSGLANEQCGSPNSIHSESDSLTSPTGVSVTMSGTFRSLRHLTREALPRLDHYRNLASIVRAPGGGQRPTLDDLHQPPGDKSGLYGALHTKPSHLSASENISLSL
ncbi:uncharacterized protein [Penaeus vannamei]|uniref:uncharacterized protein n=1 Tax=Penaeus vannamei TaxID=6689 RepID=UPI00387F77FC